MNFVKRLCFLMCVVATVPLHGVVRSGTITGTYALSGVKHGDVTMTLTFRAEREGRDGMNERDT